MSAGTLQGGFTASASLLHNNLACSANGWLVSVHNSVNQGSGKLLLHNVRGAVKKNGPEVQQTTSIRFIETPFGVTMLVVCSTNGTQIYTEDASQMLFYAQITGQATDDDKLKYHQGACAIPLDGGIMLVFGTSKGSLVPVVSTGPAAFAQSPEAVAGVACAEVADVCYLPTGEVLSAHNNGSLLIWSVAAGPMLQVSATLPATYQAPVRALAVGNRFMVAYGPGLICLYDAATKQLQAELTAHARWLTAVAYNQDGYVASVGEDTVLNVWSVDPVTCKVNLWHTSVVSDKLLTGVALSGAGAESTAYVTAYDSDEIYEVTLPLA